MDEINLGDKCTDTVSGFSGVATAKIAYLKGVTQIEITAQGIARDGKPVSEWFPVDRLKAFDA
jgi:hypothetical protein